MYCEYLCSSIGDHKTHVYHLGTPSHDGYTESYIPWPKSEYENAGIVKNGTKVQLSVARVGETGTVNIDEETCKKAFLTVLNGCPPFKTEAGETELLKYGGAAVLMTETGWARFLIELSPVVQVPCWKLGQMNPTQWCQDPSSS